MVVALTAFFVGAICVLTSVVFRGTRERFFRPSFARTKSMYQAIFSQPTAFLIMATMISEGALVMGLVPFLAGMLLERDGSGAARAGIVIGFLAVGGLMYGLFVRKLVAALGGPRRMIRVGSAIAGLGLLGVALPLNWIGVAGCFMVLGFGFYMMHNSIMLLGTELNPDARGAATSFGAFSFTTGQGLGPAVWTTVAVVASYSQMFVMAGIVLMLVGYAVSRWLGARLEALR